MNLSIGRTRTLRLAGRETQVQRAPAISRLWAKPSREEVFARLAELPRIELDPPPAGVLRDERRRR